MKNIYKIIIFSLITILILYKYKQYREFFDEICFEQEVSTLQDVTFSYVYSFFDESLNKRDNLNRMIKWSNKKRLSKKVKLLEFGVNVMYDSLSGSYVFYSFGADKIDNSLRNIPFNYLDSLHFYHFEKPNFFNYMLTKDYDIVLFNYKKSNCIMNYSSPSYAFHLFNGVDVVNSYELNKFIDLVFIFQVKNNYSKQKYNLQKILEDNKKKKIEILYFKFDKGEITNICKKGFSSELVDKLEKEMSEYFKSKDLTFMNYGVFPLILDK